MTFIRKPLESLGDFTTDADHDSLMDLVQIQCGEQWVYAFSSTPDAWSIDGAIMPQTIVRALSNEKRQHPIARGVRIDAAKIGNFLLLSMSGYDWKHIWRSTHPVTDLIPIQRSVELRPCNDFSIEENH